MLILLNPEKDGYTGAMLDDKGNAVKVVCDVLEVINYVLDADTSPMSLTATYARFDSKQQYLRAGPVTQHYITGEELAGIIDRNPDGITVEEIDKSTAKTGIPSAGIEPEDLKYDELSPAWRAEYYAQKIRDEAKKLEQQHMQPGPGPQFDTIPNPFLTEP